jgi:hypothetical protein
MFILLLLVLALLFPPAAGAAGGVGTGDTVSWEQFQKDVFNSGLTVGPALTVAPVVGWRQQVDYATKMAAGVNVTPVIAEGRVFVLGALGNAWAFEAKTGKKSGRLS